MGDEVKLTDQEVRDGAGFAALSYVSFLCILAFLFKKENEFTHFHARQGLVLFVFEVIVFFFLSFIPGIGKIFSGAGMIVFPVCSLYGIYSALTGRQSSMPGVSAIAKKLVV